MSASNEGKKDSDLLTVAEVAELLKVPRSWVYERCREGLPSRLPHIKLGKYVRFMRSDVLAYVENLKRGAQDTNSRPQGA